MVFILLQIPECTFWERAHVDLVASVARVNCRNFVHCDAVRLSDNCTNLLRALGKRLCPTRSADGRNPFPGEEPEWVVQITACWNKEEMWGVFRANFYQGMQAG